MLEAVTIGSGATSGASFKGIVAVAITGVPIAIFGGATMIFLGSVNNEDVVFLENLENLFTCNSGGSRSRHH